MKYFCIPNHRTSETFEETTLENFRSSIPVEFLGLTGDEAKAIKSKWKKFCADKGTKHCFYSTVEGSTPGLRIAGENPPRMLHGIVADYDTPPCQGGWDELVDAMIKNGLTIAPTWISLTFSHYFRCVWEFEEPIPVSDGNCDRVIRRLHEQLNTEKAWAGLDSASFKSGQVYEVGREWKKVGEPLTVDVVQKASLSAGEDVRKDVDDVGFVTEEWVEEMIAKKGWGDRVKGSIQWGMRASRFWIDDDPHDRECVVIFREGIQNFSSRGKDFYFWDEVFGKGTFNDAKGDWSGGLLEAFWYDGRIFYGKDSRGSIRTRTENQVRNMLKVNGVNPKAGKHDTCSDVDVMVDNILNDNAIDAAADVACLWNQQVVEFQGQRILNTSRLTPTLPAAVVSVDPVKDFPFIFEFLTQFFSSAEEHDLFVHFLQRLYQNILHCQGRQGPTLILVGPAGTGKTLLTNAIAGGLVGGAADASKFVSGDTSFTETLSDKPIWAIDDGTGATSFERRRTMTEIIKATSANPRVRSENKHRGAVDVPWYGRVTITANTDSTSIRSLPSLDASNRDKLLALKINDKATTNFPESDVIRTALKAELPLFAKWLLDWVAPPHCYPANDPGQENHRFGGKHYVNPDIEEMILQSSNRAEMVEMVEMFCKNVRNKEGWKGMPDPVWQGTALEFQKQMFQITDGRQIGATGKSSQIRMGLETVEDAYKEAVIPRPVTSIGAHGVKTYRISLAKEYDLILEDDLVGNQGSEPF